MKYTVYILKCADNSYYTGVTSDIARRLSEHQMGLHINSYTARRLPVELVFLTDFDSPTNAITFEKKLKKWSHAKKEALINNNWKQLSSLSKKKFN